MHGKFSSDRLRSHIKATGPVLEIFKMAGYLPDSPRRSQSDVSHNPFSKLTVLSHSSQMIFSQQYIISHILFSQSLEGFQTARSQAVGSVNLSNRAQHIHTFYLLYFTAYQAFVVFSNNSIIKKGKAVPGHIIQACRRRRCIAILIINLRIKWRQVLNFKSQLLYPLLKNSLPTE
jgi:hypothetical protein